MREGDTLALTLFVIYINDLAIEVQAQNTRVKIAVSEDISILIFADDIVLFTNTAKNLQISVSIVNEWSYKWMLKTNDGKTKVVHFWKTSIPATKYTFNIGDNMIGKTTIVAT